MLLIMLSAAWAIGLVLGSYWHFPAWTAALGLLPLILLTASRSGRKTVVTIALSLVVLLGAAAYFPVKSSLPDTISSFNARGTLEIEGTLSSDPEFKGKTSRLELSAERVRAGADWQPARGTVLILAAPYPQYHYGDVLRVKGRLEAPGQIAEFDYQAYLGKRGIFSTMLAPQIEVLARDQGFAPLSWVYFLRARLAQTLGAALNEPQASLTQGIVLGIRAFLPEEVKAEMAVTGTAQLLAISGINLTIVTGLMLALFLRLFGRRRYIYVWLTLALVWFYALLTGLEAPVVRAAIMASLFLGAELLGRQKNALAALAASAAVMTALNPQVLWDIAFQLSFLAMLGLVFITPWLRSWGERGISAAFAPGSIPAASSAVLLDSLSVTLGAILAVWPLVAYYFGLVSLIGPLANLVLAPALPAVILCGSLTALIGLFSAPLAQAAGWITWLPTTYMLELTGALAQVPFASLQADWMGANLVWAYYALLLLILLGAPYLAKAGVCLRQAVSIAATWSLNACVAVPKKYLVLPLLVLLLPLSAAAASLPDAQLHVSFLDVGEGDSSLIQSGGRSILIDGGPSPQAIVQALGSKLKFWQKSIDLLVLSHPHLDHLSGLIEVLKRYDIKQVAAANLSAETPAFLEWLDQLSRRQIAWQPLKAGQQIELGGGAGLTVLNPPDVHASADPQDLENRGLVLRLSLKEVSFLFTADVDQTLERELLNRRAGLQSTVLKVAHHGSSTSTSPEFLKAVKPELAVISVGKDNNFGHPDPTVLSRLELALPSGGRIYRTDQAGTVEFSTDGRRLWVKTAKN